MTQRRMKLVQFHFGTNILCPKSWSCHVMTYFAFDRDVFSEMSHKRACGAR